MLIGIGLTLSLKSMKITLKTSHQNHLNSTLILHQIKNSVFHDQFRKKIIVHISLLSSKWEIGKQRRLKSDTA